MGINRTAKRRFKPKTNKNIFSFGETVTYCIQWSVPAGGSQVVTITDPIDPVMTYVGSDTGGSHSAGTVTWSLGSQSAGSSGTVCTWAEITSMP